MSEAITNAFVHGNGRDKSKPIIIKWNKGENSLDIIVEDCGEKNKNLNSDEFVKKNEDILSESGRGLYIISTYTDSVTFNNNKIIMKKSLL